ncbi:NlpC/P60 family protein [Shimia sp. Alg240-R146]|uniref:NlpC/P60 family protein n=1 Tax=Shimia sp. Alg240-R146 TaxID=2993449 RepID=UPI0022E777D2|nr:NlpC/P60 family protein [Shimia sp. Alg240-R146]
MGEQGPRVAQIARQWIGTPYLHQASLQGAGADCLGLIRGIWRTLYEQEPERPPAYSRDWSEPSGNEALWRAARRHLIAKEKSAAWDVGDVLLFRMCSGAVAKHLGILVQLGPNAAFVHAYSGHGVVESALGTAWRRRVVARFEFPKESG